MNKGLFFLILCLLAMPLAAKNLDRTQPVDWAKAGLFFKVDVPEAVGFGVNVDAPLLEFLSVGGELSFTWDLPRRNSSRDTFILRTNVSVKPRWAFNDRFEVYSRVNLGPAFSFGSYRCDPNGCTDNNAVGVDFTVLPGFQFSLSRQIGIFSEIGLGVTHFPRINDTRISGVFRLGTFFAF